jgi:dTDP-glucose 4,6-dehydratase
MRALITGGAGFIGSYLIDHIYKTTDWEINCVDKLSYATKGWKRLEDCGLVYNPRVKVFTWDLQMPFSDGLIKQLGNINLIIHMAAETHVDRSIVDPVNTIANNVMSTVHLLEYARKLPNLKLFQYFSTDEVFGPASKNIAFKEWDRHCPTNPYSASKSASEAICLSYYNTYKVPVIITNLMNAFGSSETCFQFPEKFLPKVIKKVINNETVLIHTEPDGITPGSRHYISLQNIASAVMFILENVKPGEKINIPGEKEVNNLEFAKKISNIMGKELKYELIATHEDRPGHDTCYALDGTKLYSMGWKAESTFEKHLEETVIRTLQHPEWLEY